MHEMSGNEDVFRFQEESVFKFFLAVVYDANSDPHHSRPSESSTAPQ